MKYTLDASVAVKWVLREPDTAVALALRADFRNQVHEMIAPDTFPVEIAHALTKTERRGLILPGEALLRLEQVLVSPPLFYPSLPLITRAVELASQARIGVYDCLYVALAERELCLVISADQRLVNSFPAIVIPLASLGKE